VGLVKYKWDLAQIDSVVGRHQHKANFEWEIPYSELKLGAKLGKGCYGTVYRAKWRGLYPFFNLNLKKELTSLVRSSVLLMRKIFSLNSKMK
jgi:hypothetical protein